jgi:hypothetical protein
MSALRSALGAIGNAEAVDASAAPPSAGGPIAGAAHGLRATEVPRRELSVEQLVEVLNGEVREWRNAAERYQALGRSDEAARLRAQAELLEQYVPPDAPQGSE